MLKCIIVASANKKIQTHGNVLTYFLPTMDILVFQEHNQKAQYFNNSLQIKHIVAGLLDYLC